jgi:hypothetical protein
LPHLGDVKIRKHVAGKERSFAAVLPFIKSVDDDKILTILPATEGDTCF